LRGLVCKYLDSQSWLAGTAVVGGALFGTLEWETSNSPVLSQHSFDKWTCTIWAGFGSHAELCVANS